MDGLPVITIDRVVATYSVRDMFSKGIAIDRVDVTRPVVAMHHDDRGWDLGRFIKSKKEKEADTERRPIRISQIAMDNGIFSMTRTDQRTVALESIQASLASIQDARLHVRHRPASFASRNPTSSSRAPSVWWSSAATIFSSAASLSHDESSLKVNGTIRHYRSAPVFALHVIRIRSRSRDPQGVSAIGRMKLQPAVDVRTDGPLDRLETDFSLLPVGDVAAKGVTHATDTDRSFEGQVSMRHLNLSQFLDDQDWRSEIDADATVKLRVTPLRGGAQASSFLDSLHGDIDLSGRPFTCVRSSSTTCVRRRGSTAG